MPITAAEWYEPNPDLTCFFQGDIVIDVPVIFLPDKISQWFLLRPSLQGAKLLDDVLGGEICKWFEAFPEGTGTLPDKWKHGRREEFVAAKACMMNVAIVTQSCDIVNRSYYQVAPIYPETAQPENRRQQLRENGLQFAFYLPALSPSIPANSYVDLSHTTIVPKRYFPKDKVRSKLAARLTALSMTKLQEQIAEYFGRPFGFSGRDKARVAAEYACIACFYTRAQITKKRFDADTTFTKCEVCGHERWLRILPSSENTSPTEPVVRSV